RARGDARDRSAAEREDLGRHAEMRRGSEREMTFEILHGLTRVGTSELETGDPPMGVAFGRFHPAAAYETIRSTVLLAQGDLASVAPQTPEQSRAQEELISMLRVRAPDGTLLAPCSHVYIHDFSSTLGAAEIEVAICGLDATVYERYFHRHLSE